MTRWVQGPAPLIGHLLSLDCQSYLLPSSLALAVCLPVVDVPLHRLAGDGLVERSRAYKNEGFAPW